MCTTADIWTAHYRSFMGIMCHWIEPEILDWKSAALACERIMGHHTYDVIAAKISQVHAEFQIQGKVSAKVTDNGSNFVTAFNEYGGCEMEDEMESTDDVQFADVSAVLQEEPRGRGAKLFFCHLTMNVPCILWILLPRLILTKLPHSVFLENYTEVQCQNVLHSGIRLIAHQVLLIELLRKLPKWDVWYLQFPSSIGALLYFSGLLDCAWWSLTAGSQLFWTWPRKDGRSQEQRKENYKEEEAVRWCLCITCTLSVWVCVCVCVCVCLKYLCRSGSDWPFNMAAGKSVQRRICLDYNHKRKSPGGEHIHPSSKGQEQ